MPITVAVVGGGRGFGLSNSFFLGWKGGKEIRTRMKTTKQQTTTYFLSVVSISVPHPTLSILGLAVVSIDLFLVHVVAATASIVWCALLAIEHVLLSCLVWGWKVVGQRWPFWLAGLRWLVLWRLCSFLLGLRNLDECFLGVFVLPARRGCLLRRWKVQTKHDDVRCGPL